MVVTLLNKTAGRLAIPTFWRILAKWPTPLELSKGEGVGSFDHLWFHIWFHLADEEELVSTIRHLGTQTIRAKRLITLSRSYMQEPPSAYDLRPSERASLFSPNKKGSRFFEKSKKITYPATPISHLPGTGPYALDSYRIFCTIHDDPTCQEWKLVMPTDKELIRYLVCYKLCIKCLRLTFFFRNGNGPSLRPWNGLQRKVPCIPLLWII